MAAPLLGTGHAKVEFNEHDAVSCGGLLFLLPALLMQGLLKTKEVYQVPLSHYYGLESIMLTLAFMALARIKNPEQLKQCKPGELGRIIGLDRVPEEDAYAKRLSCLATSNRHKNLTGYSSIIGIASLLKKTPFFILMDIPVFIMAIKLSSPLNLFPVKNFV